MDDNHLYRNQKGVMNNDVATYHSCTTQLLCSNSLYTREEISGQYTCSHMFLVYYNIHVDLTAAYI